MCCIGYLELHLIFILSISRLVDDSEIDSGPAYLETGTLLYPCLDYRRVLHQSWEMLLIINADSKVGTQDLTLTLCDVNVLFFVFLQNFTWFLLEFF